MKKLFTLGLALALLLAGCQKTVDSSSAPESTLSSALESVSQPVEEVSVLPQGMDEAMELNSDTVGWLQLPGTEIDGPVLQGTDNDYYLRRSLDKTYDVWGSYFVDYECHVESAEAFDRVTILYGHSLEDHVNAPHFSQIKHYADPDYAAENPLFYYTTPGAERMAFRVFAAGIVPETLPYLDPDPDDDALQSLVDEFRRVSVLPYEDVAPTMEDTYMILSTCTSQDDTRFVVVAVLDEIA